MPLPEAQSLQIKKWSSKSLRITVPKKPCISGKGLDWNAIIITTLRRFKVLEVIVFNNMFICF